MITASNTDELAKQLEEYSKEVERRLKNMVEQFAVDVVQAASSNTRLGDSKAYADFYAQRQKTEGWDAIEGMAQGGWVIALDGTPAFVERHGFRPEGTTDQAVAQAKVDSQGYKLGQSFVIGNAVPYVPQFAEEIKAPTLMEIQAAMESDLKRYYDAG